MSRGNGLNMVAATSPLRLGSVPEPQIGHKFDTALRSDSGIAVLLTGRPFASWEAPGSIRLLAHAWDVVERLADLYARLVDVAPHCRRVCVLVSIIEGLEAPRAHFPEAVEIHSNPGCLTASGRMLTLSKECLERVRVIFWLQPSMRQSEDEDRLQFPERAWPCTSVFIIEMYQNRRRNSSKSHTSVKIYAQVGKNARGQCVYVAFIVLKLRIHWKLGSLQCVTIVFRRCLGIYQQRLRDQAKWCWKPTHSLVVYKAGIPLVDRIKLRHFKGISKYVLGEDNNFGFTFCFREVKNLLGLSGILLEGLHNYAERRFFKLLDLRKGEITIILIHPFEVRPTPA
jgi:hypothetical protein